MEDIEHKAESYAVSALEPQIDRIKKAYLAGFEEAKMIYGPSKIDIDGVTFYDLNLPSGTLWSEPLQKSSFEHLHVPYINAAEYQLPTIEQFNELCQVEHKPCINPNICLFTNRYGKKYSILQKYSFWIKAENPLTENDYMTFDGMLRIKKCYCGYPNYVIIVKNKNDIK